MSRQAAISTNSHTCLSAAPLRLYGGVRQRQRVTKMTMDFTATQSALYRKHEASITGQSGSLHPVIAVTWDQQDTDWLGKVKFYSTKKKSILLLAQSIGTGEMKKKGKTSASFALDAMLRFHYISIPKAKTSPYLFSLCTPIWTLLWDFTAPDSLHGWGKNIFPHSPARSMPAASCSRRLARFELRVSQYDD